MRVVVVLVLLIGIFACVVLACMGGGNKDVPTPVDVAEDTLESCGAGQSGGCKVCMIGGKCSQCTGVCNCSGLQVACNDTCWIEHDKEENAEKLNICIAGCGTTFGTETE